MKIKLHILKCSLLIFKTNKILFERMLESSSSHVKAQENIGETIE